MQLWGAGVLSTAPAIAGLYALRRTGSRSSTGFSIPKLAENPEVARAARGLEAAKPLPNVFSISPSAPSFRFPAVEQKRRVRMLRDTLQGCVGAAAVEIAPVCFAWTFGLRAILLDAVVAWGPQSWASLAADILEQSLCSSSIWYSLLSTVLCAFGATFLLLSFAIPATLLSEHTSFAPPSPSLDAGAALPRSRLCIDALLPSGDRFRRVHALREISLGASFIPSFRAEVFRDASRETWKQLFDRLVSRIDEFTQHLQLRALSTFESGSHVDWFSSQQVLFGKSKPPVLPSSFSTTPFSILLSEVSFAIVAASRLVVASRSEDSLGVVNVCRSAPFLLESLLSLQLALDTLVGGSLVRKRLESTPYSSQLQQNADSNAHKGSQSVKALVPHISGQVLSLPVVLHLNSTAVEAVYAVLLEFYEELFKLHDFRPEHQRLLQYYADMLMG